MTQLQEAQHSEVSKHADILLAVKAPWSSQVSPYLAAPRFVSVSSSHIGACHSLWIPLLCVPESPMHSNLQFQLLFYEL